MYAAFFGFAIVTFARSRYVAANHSRGWPSPKPAGPSRSSQTHSHLHLRPNLGPRVFRMQRRVLTQQLLGALVLHHWSLDGDFDDLIAALARARILDALLPEPEF